MTEALTLVFLGGIAGVALAALLIDLAIPLIGTTILESRRQRRRRVLGFALTLTLVTSVLFSVALRRDFFMTGSTIR